MKQEKKKELSPAVGVNSIDFSFSNNNTNFVLQFTVKFFYSLKCRYVRIFRFFNGFASFDIWTLDIGHWTFM